MECNILFDSGDHKVDYVGKYSNKMAVEICKSYECLKVSNVHRGLSILNSFNFLGVYLDTFGRNNQS